MTTPVLRPRSREVGGLADSPGATPGPVLIVVGGVPGAGKSTLLARIADDVPGGVVLDPDRYRRRLASRVPSWLPYDVYRWAVHTLHAVVVLVRVLVAVDVSLAEALDGQLDRGRVVRPEQFVRHWSRWTAQRAAFAGADGGPRGPWSGVYLMARCDAFRQVRDLARWRVAGQVR